MLVSHDADKYHPIIIYNGNKMDMHRHSLAIKPISTSAYRVIKVNYLRHRITPIVSVRDVMVAFCPNQLGF